MKTSKEAQNIAAELARIDKELGGIAADIGVLEMQRAGLLSARERVARCLQVRKPAQETAPAAKRPRKPRTASKTMVGGEPRDKYMCLDCGHEFPIPGVAKGNSPCCPDLENCGSLQIQEIA